MDHQGAPNVNFHHYTLKNLELAKNWPSSGPRLSQISTYINWWTSSGLQDSLSCGYFIQMQAPRMGFRGRKVPESATLWWQFKRYSRATF